MLLAFTHFGGWSAHAVLLANGVHEWCRPCTLHPTLPQARQHTLYAALSLWKLDIKTFWAHLWPLPSKRGKATHRHGTRAQQLPLPSPSLKSTYVKIRDKTSCSRGAFCGISDVLSPSGKVHEGRIPLGGAECPWSRAGGLRQWGVTFHGLGVDVPRRQQRCPLVCGQLREGWLTRGFDYGFYAVCCGLGGLGWRSWVVEVVFPTHQTQSTFLTACHKQGARHKHPLFPQKQRASTLRCK